MLFIHQFPDWTHFRFDTRRVLDALGETRLLEGRLIGTMNMCGLGKTENEILASDIVANFAMDGHDLDLDAIQKEVELRSQAKQNFVKNYLGAIVNSAMPLTAERLFNWHASMSPSKSMRLRETPSRIEFSNGDSTYVFDGPWPERLETEVENFIKWFETSTMDGVIKAAITHFWFLTLRPFNDANGRVARTLMAMQLARAAKTTHCQYALNVQMVQNRAEYFCILNRTQCGNGDLTDWILWFLTQIDEAIEKRKESIQTEIRHAMFMNKISGTPIGEREQQLLEASLAGTIPQEFTAKDVAMIFGTSHDTALREIQSLIKKGMVKANQKGGRSQRYSLVE
jgi:Fic family protein